MSDEIRDPVSKEKLSLFTGQTSDGRQVTVTARDEEQANALIREQSGVGVLSVKAGAPKEKAEKADDKAESKAAPKKAAPKKAAPKKAAPVNKPIEKADPTGPFSSASDNRNV